MLGINCSELKRNFLLEIAHLIVKTHRSEIYYCVKKNPKTPFRLPND